MAAAIAPQFAMIDLKDKASFPVRLGSSILQPSKTGTFTSVRYNHKPKSKSQKEAQYTLRTSEKGKETLLFQDGKDQYQYDGQAAREGGWYILVRKGDSQDDTTSLERVDVCHEFNLVKTPSEKDSAKLVTQFDQLPNDQADDLSGEEVGFAEPLDSNNPWDYRNYLKKPTRKLSSPAYSKPKSASSNHQAPQSAASSTPTSRPVKPTPSPLLTQMKRKAQTSAKMNSKRVKAGTEEPRPPVGKPAKPSQEVPQVRIDRKASIRRPSVDDSGELILENETPVTEKPPKRAGAMALALSGQLGGGPISLKSAASSPASRVASPMPPRPEGMDEGEEFELGESSPEVENKRPPKQREEDYFGGDDDGPDGEDADADVEDLELPSPAQTHRKSVSTATVTGPVDDEDDLDAQLQAAMMEDDDSGIAPARPAESDEESEEE